MNKKELAIILSKLQTFQKQNVSLEQYQTECEIAADALWNISLEGNIKGKLIGDFGSGNGIFGIGALLLGAKKVIFVDVDEATLAIAKNNLQQVEKTIGKKYVKQFVHTDIKDFKKKVDLVIQNPPFGVKRTHIDKLFLMKAMQLSKIAYSFHKTESRQFLKQFTQDEGWSLQYLKKYKFPLKKTAIFHKKKVYYVDVGLWKIFA